VAREVPQRPFSAVEVKKSLGLGFVETLEPGVDLPRVLRRATARRRTSCGCLSTQRSTASCIGRKQGEFRFVRALKAALRAASNFPKDHTGVRLQQRPIQLSASADFPQPQRRDAAGGSGLTMVYASAGALIGAKDLLVDALAAVVE